MFQVGCALVCSALALYALVTVPSALSARDDLAARDFCCDPELMIGGSAYRLSDSSAISIDTFAKILLDARIADSSTLMREALAAHKKYAREFDRARALRRGDTESAIDARLGITPDYRLSREYLLKQGSLLRLWFGYSSAAGATFVGTIGVVCLWWWFGSRSDAGARPGL
jgi:hypothetical protein